MEGGELAGDRARDLRRAATLAVSLLTSRSRCILSRLRSTSWSVASSPTSKAATSIWVPRTRATPASARPGSSSSSRSSSPPPPSCSGSGRRIETFRRLAFASSGSSRAGPSAPGSSPLSISCGPRRSRTTYGGRAIRKESRRAFRGSRRLVLNVSAAVLAIRMIRAVTVRQAASLRSGTTNPPVGPTLPVVPVDH